MRIWYDRSASDWTQGLPIGNGSLGAVVCSGAESEIWHLTETTYWSGRAERTISLSKGKAGLAEMRQLFFDGDYANGERLVEQQLMPEKGNFGTNVPMCDVKLTFDHAEEVFVRELNVAEAIVRTGYSSGGVRYEREMFATHADNVAAARIRSERPSSLSFAIDIEGRSQTFHAWADAHGEGAASLHFNGRATEHVHSDGTCGVNGRGILRVCVSGGSVRIDRNRIVVELADEASIYFAAATDYRTEDGQWLEEPELRIDLAVRKGFDGLKARHLADYRKLYGRVNVELGSGAEMLQADDLATDKRILRMRENGGQGDPQLYALFYQFGRYLMIAGSREDSKLPMHLQGIWNDGEAARMAWSCDFHLDVNTEMNYYPAETGNLAECHLPLLRFVERLAEAGKTAAQDFYGCEGWVAHVFTNAWGFAAPGWHYSWGLNVTGGLWLAAQLREHYEFSRDDAFLRNLAYPVLREAAAFYLDYMVCHPETGHLVTGPSNSPENSFYPDDEQTVSYTMSMGSVMDTMLVRELFGFCIESSVRLGTDEEFRVRLETALPLLPPLAVGGRGQLQEWLKDYGEAQPDHRHLSHLYGLYPGREITPEAAPALAAAARQTLDNRQRGADLEDVEFTLALFAAGRARLHDGDKAREHLTYLISQLCLDNMLTFSKSGIAGAEVDIFVVDGNFGGAAAFAEMLLQSHAGEIHILPALPQDWPAGRFAGLRARGDAEVEALWENGSLTAVTVKANRPLETRLRYGRTVIDLRLDGGESREFNGMLVETVTEKGIN
ncbi:glycoside hydrolase N-terminal domain-containing protein [Paenibacillus sp. R14(2021)]|uniref:glycoside hydrolase family 95 protein n=1 Tax=Paenibacillus sp. R14(2021) TaxID=2859228 RepID=UPI001C6146A7|nr:glycoside hydrolase family 95 protein [Paenibacillus sp. R14(2021)]